MNDNYKSLLPEGDHLKTFEELIAICVSHFAPDNIKRMYLINNLHKYIIVPLNELNFTCSLWINGSFLTDKVEPNDIDLIIKIENANLCTLDQKAFLYTFIDTNNHIHFRNNFFLDVYFLSNDISGFNNHEYWYDWFTHDRNANGKGFIVLDIHGGVR